MANKPIRKTGFHDIRADNCAQRVQILPSQRDEKRFSVIPDRVCPVCPQKRRRRVSRG